MPRLAAATTGQPRQSPHGTEGYSCTLYKDYLVLYGGRENGAITGGVSVYNLKKKAREQNMSFGAGASVPKVFHSACLNSEGDIVICFGGQSDLGRDPKENLNIGLTKTGGSLVVLLELT